jgi:hypothetical protein
MKTVPVRLDADREKTLEQLVDPKTRKIAGLGQIFLWRNGPGVQQETPQGLRPLKAILLDTGVIVGLLARSEDNHSAWLDGTSKVIAGAQTSRSTFS